MKQIQVGGLFDGQCIKLSFSFLSLTLLRNLNESNSTYRFLFVSSRNPILITEFPKFLLTPGTAPGTPSHGTFQPATLAQPAESLSPHIHFVGTWNPPSLPRTMEKAGLYFPPSSPPMGSPTLNLVRI